MAVPEWLRSKMISVQFRAGQEAWQPALILLDECGGSYTTLSGDEGGSLDYIAHGTHPRGGEVMILHWHENYGPLKGHTGVETLWFQPQDQGLNVRGTFFIDEATDYGEISGAT